jgi:hypothetical protein
MSLLFPRFFIQPPPPYFLVRGKYFMSKIINNFKYIVITDKVTITIIGKCELMEKVNFFQDLTILTNNVYVIYIRTYYG